MVALRAPGIPLRRKLSLHHKMHVVKGFVDLDNVHFKLSYPGAAVALLFSEETSLLPHLPTITI